MKALGAGTRISKSEVSRICASLHEEVAAFDDRPLAESTYPYVFLHATFPKARVAHRVLPQAVVVAAGVAVDVATDRRREVLGLKIGNTESQPFWTTLLPSLKTRGFDGVKPVISDTHSEMNAAVETVFIGSN